jgi:tetratricopeptide (TPR) repeat protein
LSFSRKLLFAALLSGFVLAVLLGGLEGGLRLAGYGHSAHFFRRVALPGGETIWRENPWCTAPYFSTALVRRPQPVRLPEKKAPGTCRIFVLGSSAAMGDPEASFSLARMLETLLRAAYPRQRFEVVNAAITAINSHLVRGIALDCAQLEPDLFIVYEGNNEVIGPFGPAGVFAPFLATESGVRTAAWLKRTRTAQLISALRRGGAAPAEWGGMEMFMQQQIGADDPRLPAVRANFRANLLAIAAAGRSAGATTLACTVLTNQRDFAPFLSRHRPGLTAAELAQWQTDSDAAAKMQQAGDLPGAETAFRSAYALENHYAESVFRFGHFALRMGRDTDARDLLQRALDLDTLRFRTDSRLNQTIRELASTKIPQLEVVDLAAALAPRSPHGIIGDELLYEHVHLTFHGTYEVVRELFPRIAADLARRGLTSGPLPEPCGEDEARLRLGFTAYEQAMIAQNLLGRFRRPPFTGQLDNPVRVQTWERHLAAATTLLNRPAATPALLQLYQQALAITPDDWVLARNAGAMLVSRQAPAEALPLLERAARWIDDDIDTLVPLGQAQQALGHKAEAAIIFAQARKIEPQHPGLPRE